MTIKREFMLINEENVQEVTGIILHGIPKQIRKELDFKYL